MTRTILTIPKLRKFLKEQDKNKRYRPGSCTHCMIGQFLRYQGFTNIIVKINDFDYSYRTVEYIRIPIPKRVNFIAGIGEREPIPGPNVYSTFGEALERLEGKRVA